MSQPFVRKSLTLLAVFGAAWLSLRYLLPLLLPFVAGAALAWAAEPVVAFAAKKCHMPRWLAAGLGVTLLLVLLMAVLAMAGALIVRELGQLAGAVPGIMGRAQQALSVLQDWLLGLAGRLPDGISAFVTQTVLRLFGGGMSLLDEVTKRLPGILTSVLGWIPDGFLAISTGILAGFMISARLPRMKQSLRTRIPAAWRQKYLPAIGRARRTLGCWLRAQGMLAAVTYGIVTAGFLLLGVPFGPLWALLVALVDAVPLLGTGTILVPWAVAELLQGRYWMATGLVCVYALSAVTRAALEPRLLGKQLGLDPLVTLLALYVGYQIWGVLGMLLAPMLATVAKTFTDLPPQTLDS